MALNPIQGGGSIDLYAGMCFLAYLISNWHFEVNDINILCFLDFLFFIWKVMELLWKYLMVCAYFCLAQKGRLIYLAESVWSNLPSEFYGKHWFCSFIPFHTLQEFLVSYIIFVFVLISRVKRGDFNRSGWGESNLASQWHLEVCQFVLVLYISAFH